MADSEPQAEKTIAQQIDELFAPWNRTDAPGLVVGVAKDGEVIYRRGFGMASLETAVANTPSTRMRIGSTSKHFTCLLALLLAEEGKLDIDAPIRTYVAELVGPAGDPTLRELMQHRGGSRCYLDLAFIGRGVTLAPNGTALEALARQTGRNFAPGEAMIYNNGGYHLLSIAIERAGGAPFEAQLKERLFDPVGMTDTASIPSDHEITPGIATMHLPLPDGRWRRGLFPSDEVRGEGAIVSTVDDMLRWMAHLRTRDRFGSAATWNALVTPPTYADGATGVYALGLMINEYRGLPTVHHAGGVMGGSSQMLTLAGLDIIVMANGARAADPVRLAEQIVDIVLADQLGPAKATVPAKDVESLLGDWWSAETGMIYSLIDDEGALKLGVNKAPYTVPLERAEGERLILPAGSVGEIGIVPDAAKDAISVDFGGRRHPHQRVSEDAADKAAFAQAVVGQYSSADADATATIAQDGERLTLRLADRHGAVAVGLRCVGETVAFTKPPSALVPLNAVLTFAKEDGRATGFRLNTMRTRDLEFTRN